MKEGKAECGLGITEMAESAGRRERDNINLARKEKSNHVENVADKIQ